MAAQTGSVSTRLWGPARPVTHLRMIVLAKGCGGAYPFPIAFPHAPGLTVVVTPAAR